MEKEIGDAWVLKERGKNERERQTDRQTEGERERRCSRVENGLCGIENMKRRKWLTRDLFQKVTSKEEKDI